MYELKTTLEEVTDPEHIARFRAGRERHALNDQVFRQRMQEIYRDYRGKVIIIAGRELPASDTAEEAWAWAADRHPEDDAPLVQYIPKERAWRIYGTRG